jgi:acid phosphatase class B
MKSVTKALMTICIVGSLVSISAACNGPNCSQQTTTSSLPSQADVMQVVNSAKASAPQGNFSAYLFNDIKTRVI